MYSGGLAPDGKVYCRHIMEEAAKRTSNTPKHPNREFYCCKRLQSDQTKCKFWCWADQISRALVHPSGPSMVQSPPRTPKGGTRGQPTATLPTPQKQFSPSPAEIPQSKRRLEDIEAGLKQREQDHSPIRHQASPSKVPVPSTSLSEVQSVPQSPSPVPTEIDEEVEVQPRRSFLGLDRYSPEPIASTVKAEDQPSIPKKRRLTPPAKDAEIQQVADAVSFGGRVPLTPPRTTRRVVQPDGSEPGPATMRSRKGKERGGAPAVWTQDLDACSGGPQEEDSLPVFTLSGDAISVSSASPTIAENVLDYTDGMRARVKALSEYVDSFDIREATKLLQTIERQKLQYECRDRSQKMRIEELVAERDKLVAEVTRLKESIR